MKDMLTAIAVNRLNQTEWYDDKHLVAETVETVKEVQQSTLAGGEDAEVLEGTKKLLFFCVIFH